MIHYLIVSYISLFIETQQYFREILHKHLAMNLKTLFKIAVTILVTISNENVFGKIYSRCELAWELYEYHNIPRSQLSTWVCLAHDSNYNTASSKGKSLGIFQIHEDHWMKPCDMTLNDFFDDSISDDINCAKRIYKAHLKSEGDGFLAWEQIYKDCKNKGERFLKGCFRKFGKKCK